MEADDSAETWQILVFFSGIHARALHILPSKSSSTLQCLHTIPLPLIFATSSSLLLSRRNHWSSTHYPLSTAASL